MDRAAVKIRKLAEKVLADDGALPLALLLEHLAPVERLRELAQKFGVTPKGGFRLERAPAKVLAPRLAEERDKDRLAEVLALLVPEAPDEAPADVAAGDPAAVKELQALLKLRDAEVARLRSDLDRSREGARRGREREVEIEQRLAQAQEELVRARREAADLSAAATAKAAPRGPDKQTVRRLHDLESEREGLLAADQALRRQLARDRSRVRELEDEVRELESLIPKSRRRKKKPMPEEPEPVAERRFLVPHFQPSFYKSLQGKERRSVERALQAILLFCTEGHGYPGLEVKPMGGQDTWSLRASLGLRVYFRPREGGDIDVLELGDREDQTTTLRRLKEK